MMYLGQFQAANPWDFGKWMVVLRLFVDMASRDHQVGELIDPSYPQRRENR